MKGYWDWAILCIIMVVFLIIKIPHLSLPYYWDEATFAQAVHAMYEVGPALWPSAIDTELSRGHPVLFHFLASTWMMVFGDSITAAHTYPLVLSFLLLVVVFLFCKRFLNAQVGLVACVLLCCQTIFLAQASFLLLEMQLALLVMATLYAVFSKRRLWYMVFGSMLLLTKEPGLILIITIAFFRGVILVKSKASWKQYFLASILIGSPLIVAGLYFVVQKIIHGWFFFPLHVELISFSWVEVMDKLESYAAYLFIYYGRNGLSGALLAAVVIIFWKKIKFTSVEKQVVFLSSLYVVFFILLISLNFYSPRYIMAVFPPFLIVSTYLVYTAFVKWKAILVLVFVGIAGVQVWFCTLRQTNTDHNLGYVDAVILHQEVIQYCEENDWTTRPIFAHYMMRLNLTDDLLGYLTGEEFTNVKHVPDAETEIFIISNVEYQEEFDDLKLSGNLNLLKRFERRNAWTEVYEDRQ